jgi:hypothetical protein
MFQHPTPIGVSYDFILGYQGGQKLVTVSPSLDEHAILVFAWQECKEAAEEFPVKCEDFVPAFYEGYQDQLQGLAHPLSESEEE